MSEDNINHVHPSELYYRSESGSSNSLRRQNFARVRDVCDELEKQDIRISIAEVARRCVEGGPAYSTLANGGSKLGAYVRMRSAEQAVGRGAGVKSIEALVMQITDPVFAAQLQDQVNQARWFKRENNVLRSLLKTVQPGADIDGAIDDARSGRGKVLRFVGASQGAPSPELNAAVVKLFDHLIRDRRYDAVRGRLTVNQKIVLSSAEVDLFRSASGLSETAWRERYGAL